MSMIAHFLAVPQTDLDAFFAVPESILAYYENHQGDVVDLDKAWYGIHFLLNGDVTDGETPLEKCVLGGIEVGDVALGYGPARGLSAVEVAEIASALAAVSEEAFRALFNAEELEAAGVYPTIWHEGSGALEYLVPYFIELKRFYVGAAANGLAAVLFIV